MLLRDKKIICVAFSFANNPRSSSYCFKTLIIIIILQNIISVSTIVIDIYLL